MISPVPGNTAIPWVGVTGEAPMRSTRGQLGGAARGRRPASGGLHAHGPADASKAASGLCAAFSASTTCTGRACGQPCACVYPRTPWCGAQRAARWPRCGRKLRAEATPRARRLHAGPVRRVCGWHPRVRRRRSTLCAVPPVCHAGRAGTVAVSAVRALRAVCCQRRSVPRRLLSRLPQRANIARPPPVHPAAPLRRSSRSRVPHAISASTDIHTDTLSIHRTVHRWYIHPAT